MFGNSWLGGSFFGDSYWGPDQGATPPGGGGKYRGRTRVGRSRASGVIHGIVLLILVGL